MTKPTLSVLIDTYNHEQFIEQAVVSAIEQDFPASDYEIVVIDDGSTDRTPDIVRKFAPRVRLLRKKNGGQASAFNAAFPELRGEIVAFLDGDDWFAPGKLMVVMTALDEHPEVAAVGHGHYEFREETKCLRIYTPPHQGFCDLATPESARTAVVALRSLLMGALTMRKAALANVLPISELLFFCADAPIQAAAMARGALVLQEPLFYYRHHGSNLYSHESSRKDLARTRRKIWIHRLALEQSLRAAIRLGASPECARQFVWPGWIYNRRRKLQLLGGSPLDILRTEIHCFQVEIKNPTVAHRIFEYVTVGVAAVVLPPRTFYMVRNWRPISRLWYWFLDVTYAPRHAIGLNRRRAAESSAKAAD